MAAATAVDASVSVVTPMLLQPDGIVGPMVPADAASAMEMMDITEFAEFVSDMPWRERTYLVAQFRVRKVGIGGTGQGQGRRQGYGQSFTSRCTYLVAQVESMART